MYSKTRKTETKLSADFPFVNYFLKVFYHGVTFHINEQLQELDAVCGYEVRAYQWMSEPCLQTVMRLYSIEQRDLT